MYIYVEIVYCSATLKQFRCRFSSHLNADKTSYHNTRVEKLECFINSFHNNGCPTQKNQILKYLLYHRSANDKM